MLRSLASPVAIHGTNAPTSVEVVRHELVEQLHREHRELQQRTLNVLLSDAKAGLLRRCGAPSFSVAPASR